MNPTLFSNIFSAVLLGILAFSALFILFKPRIPLYYFIFLILTVNASGYGMKYMMHSLYDRRWFGVGWLFPIPFFELFLIFLFIYFAAKSPSGTISNYNKWPMAFFLIVSIFYFIYGLAGNIPPGAVFDKKGIVNIDYMIFLSFVLSWGIRDNEDLHSFKKMFLFSVTVIGIFGLVRYLFFGGDPSNIYRANSLSKLTYFDYAFSTVFAIGICYSAIKIFQRSYQGSLEKYYYYFIVGAGSFNILFSFRRSAWAGLLLVSLWIFFNVRVSTKILLVSLVIPILLVMGPYVVHKRFSGERTLNGKQDSMLSDLTNKKGEVQYKRGRFSELYSAYETWLEHPLIGVGPWGTHVSSALLGEHAFFVHSSVFHMLFKTGLLGTVPYLSIFVFYVIGWLNLRRKRWKDNDLKYFAEAFFAGFLFVIPDVLFGTPIIIIRHMLMYALILTVPLISYRVQRDDGQSA